MLGNLFDGIFIRRWDKEKNIVHTLPVPLKYGPREKYLAMLAEPAQTKPVAIQLPMMSFELKSFRYDKDRKLNTLNKLTSSTSDRNSMYSSFQTVPYKLTFEMTVIAKFNDDASQIIEQIIPYFTPSHFNTINLIPELNKDFDIRVELTDVEPEIVYEDDFLARNLVMWRLSFEVDAWFVGPIQTKGVIKRVIVNFAGNNDNTYIDERVIITPGLTPQGTPTSDKSESIPYKDIDAEDDYGYVEEWYTYQDPKLETDIEQD